MKLKNTDGDIPYVGQINNHFIEKKKFYFDGSILSLSSDRLCLKAEAFKGTVAYRHTHFGNFWSKDFK